MAVAAVGAVLMKKLKERRLRGAATTYQGLANDESGPGDYGDATHLAMSGDIQDENYC